ncbi:MAG: hypothetical protein IJB96_00645 [Lachnospira sp.]|nr:hypothetical protein [Lachnospira sp.]
MLCVKCGEEYEGASCPRCEGPQILVNNDDYLRRKRAYEEKQAQGSASLSNEAESNPEVDFIVQLANKVSKTVKDKKKEKAKEQKRKRKTRINVKAVVIAAVALAAIITAIVLLVTSLGGKKNLYARYNGNVYVIKKDNMVQVGADDNTFFTADEKHFYESTILKDYKAECIIDKQASEKGKLLTAVIYDESTSLYKLMLSNNKDVSCVAESDKRMDIVYVSDNGELVYTALDVVNDEGYAGAYELYIYEALNAKKSLEEGSVKQLTDSLKHTYVLAGRSKVLFVDADSNLCVYDYISDKSVECIAENVTGVYIMENEYEDRYSFHTGYVSVSDASVGIIYNEKGRCYYSDFSSGSGERVYMGAIPTGVTTMVYKKNEYMYYRSGDKLSITTFNKVLNETGNGYTTVLDTKELATVNDKSDLLWISDKDSLIYVNSNNDMCMVKKEKVTVLHQNVKGDSIKYIAGSKSGIVYSKDGEWYYNNELNDRGVRISLPEQTNVKETIRHNGKLYILLDSEKLYAYKSGELKEINSAQYIWLDN